MAPFVVLGQAFVARGHPAPLGFDKKKDVGSSARRSRLGHEELGRVPNKTMSTFTQHFYLCLGTGILLVARPQHR